MPKFPFEQIIEDTIKYFRMDGLNKDTLSSDLSRQVLFNLNAYGYKILYNDPDHVIEFLKEGWTLRHSLECRESGQLFTCEFASVLYIYLEDSGIPELGRYTMYLDEYGWPILEPRTVQED